MNKVKAPPKPKPLRMTNDPMSEPNFNYVKQQKDREAWLMHHLDVMTFEERRLFWDCLGEIIRGEIKLTMLYQEIKGRVDKQKEG